MKGYFWVRKNSFEMFFFVPHSELQKVQKRLFYNTRVSYCNTRVSLEASSLVYRLKPQTNGNVSAPPNAVKQSGSQKPNEWPDVQSGETSFTPLAQYFTFTGRLNPVPEVKPNLEHQNRNKVIEKFETNSYKLKLRSQEARGEGDEIGNDEKGVFGNANGTHDTGKLSLLSIFSRP